MVLIAVFTHAHKVSAIDYDSVWTSVVRTVRDGGRRQMTLVTTTSTQVRIAFKMHVIFAPSSVLLDSKKNCVLTRAAQQSLTYFLKPVF